MPTGAVLYPFGDPGTVAFPHGSPSMPRRPGWRSADPGRRRGRRAAGTPCRGGRVDRVLAARRRPGAGGRVAPAAADRGCGWSARAGVRSRSSALPSSLPTGCSAGCDGTLPTLAPARRHGLGMTYADARRRRATTPAGKESWRALDAHAPGARYGRFFRLAASLPNALTCLNLVGRQLKVDQVAEPNVRGGQHRTANRQLHDGSEADPVANGVLDRTVTGVEVDAALFALRPDSNVRCCWLWTGSSPARAMRSARRCTRRRSPLLSGHWPRGRWNGCRRWRRGGRRTGGSAPSRSDQQQLGGEVVLLLTVAASENKDRSDEPYSPRGRPTGTLLLLIS